LLVGDIGGSGSRFSVLLELPSEERGGRAPLPDGDTRSPASSPARGEGGLGLEGLFGKIWRFMWVLESGEFSGGGGGGNLHCWRKWVLSSIAITEEGERERERLLTELCFTGASETERDREGEGEKRREGGSMYKYSRTGSTYS